jgi:tetratricopeptide (TPR) repeat protein
VTTPTNAAGKTHWTNTQAFALAIASLILGSGGGYLIRRSLDGPTPSPAATSLVPLNSSMGAQPMPLSPAQLNDVANTQATAKIEQLKTDPNNVGLLIELGNIYYDSKQYPNAIEYYKRVLILQPANADVRTDLGTSYWYIGDADTAISEFNKSLNYSPTKVNTLFNLGLVQFKGKKDSAAAVATWHKLLATNPGYEQKEMVQKLIAEAQAYR